MLEKVILLIEENILQKKVLCGESVLTDDLREHGIGIEIGECKVPQPGDAGENLADTLYITDSEDKYHALRQQGRYALPYRHEENRDADFTGALYVIEQIEEVDFETVDMAYRRLACLPWDILTTKRCKIRETTVEDADSFYEIYAEPSITEYMEDLYADRDEEIAYIKEYRKKVYEFYGYGMWTVLTREGTVIGRAGVSWREGFELPELGFMIGVPWQRQGYAYEVCSAILDYARDELGFTQMQALVMEGNEKSAALCEKLGFEKGKSVELEGDKYVMYCFWSGRK